MTPIAVKIIPETQVQRTTGGANSDPSPVGPSCYSRRESKSPGADTGHQSASEGVTARKP